MLGFLLDTNHLSAVIARVSRTRERLREVHRSGMKLGTCFPVLCELETGIQQTLDPQSYRQRLKTILAHVRIWPMNSAVARLYGETFLELLRLGRILSQVDMMVPDLARQMVLTLLTTDRDFDALPEIRTVNWL